MSEVAMNILDVSIDNLNNSQEHERSDIGVVLNAIRIQRKLEIIDIAERLKIRKNYLIAIESGDISDLPGDAYALGYLRTYAKFLGYFEPVTMNDVHILRGIVKTQNRNRNIVQDDTNLFKGIWNVFDSANNGVQCYHKPSRFKSNKIIFILMLIGIIALLGGALIISKIIAFANDFEPTNINREEEIHYNIEENTTPSSNILSKASSPSSIPSYTHKNMIEQLELNKIEKYTNTK